MIFCGANRPADDTGFHIWMFSAVANFIEPGGAIEVLT
jgi:hypothetical protein